MMGIPFLSLKSMTTALETVGNEFFCIEPQPPVSLPIPANMDTIDVYVAVVIIAQTVTAETLPIFSNFPTTAPSVDSFLKQVLLRWLPPQCGLI